MICQPTFFQHELHTKTIKNNEVDHDNANLTAIIREYYG